MCASGEGRGGAGRGVCDAQGVWLPHSQSLFQSGRGQHLGARGSSEPGKGREHSTIEIFVREKSLDHCGDSFLRGGKKGVKPGRPAIKIVRKGWQRLVLEPGVRGESPVFA